MQRKHVPFALLAALAGVVGLLFFLQGGDRKARPLAGDSQDVAAVERQPVGLDASAESAAAAAESGFELAPAVRVEVGDAAAGNAGAAPRRVTARLVDGDGEPISGGVLGLIPFPRAQRHMLDAFRAVVGGDNGELRRLETRTRTDGRATIRPPDQGESFVLFGRASGREIGIVVLDPVPEDEHDAGDLVLLPGVRGRVIVRNELGEGVAQVGVALIGNLDDDNNNRRLPFRFDLTGADGVLEVDYLPDSKYQVMVDASGFVAAEVKDHDFGAEPELAIDLSRGLPVHGMATWDDGSAASGIRIELVRENQNFFLDISDYTARAPWAVTDEQGRFSNYGVGEGERHRLRAIPPVGEAVESERFQGAADLEAIRIELPRNHEVRGKLVLADGRPAAGAKLAWQQVGNNNLHGKQADEPVFADDAGAFSVYLPGASYRTLAWHQEAEHSFETPFAVVGDLDLGSLRMPRSGTLEVEVVSQADGGPVEVPTITRALRDPQRSSGNDEEYREARGRQRRVGLLSQGRVAEVERPEPGLLRITGLPEGTHSFDVRAAGHVADRFEASVVAGEVRNVRVVLAPAAELRVTVLTHTGDEPEDRIQLQLDPVAGQSARSRGSSTRTDKAGQARFNGLNAGPYVLSLRPENSGDAIELARIDLPAGSTERTVHLPPALALEVAVVRADGLPASGVEVQMRAASRSGNGPVRARGRSARETTDEFGVARYSNLTPGLYSVEIRPRGTIVSRQLVDLQTDQRVEFLTGGLEIAGRVQGPLDGVRVVIERQGARDDPVVQLGARRGSAKPDEHGFFRFGDLDPGDYRVFAEGGGRLPAHHTEVALGSASVRGVVLETVAEASLVIRVTGLVETNQRRIYALAVGENDRGSTTPIRKSGDHRMRGLMPGAYAVTIVDSNTSQEYATYSVDVSADRETVIEWDAALGSGG
ncbi:MAG TPA: carboxypeptidase-like regulatory domain-containing protein [Planctomycetota bacterium]